MDRLDLLIVEDHTDTSKTLLWLIRGLRRDLTVEAVHTIADAISALYARRPLRIATDLNLPDGNGLAFIAEARALLPDARIAAFTAYGDDRTRGDAKRAGADAYEVKPLTPEAAMAALGIEVQTPGEEGRS